MMLMQLALTMMAVLNVVAILDSLVMDFHVLVWHVKSGSVRNPRGIMISELIWLSH